MVEHFVDNENVGGSSPSSPIRLIIYKINERI